jgi:hypothetical protein
MTTQRIAASAGPAHSISPEDIQAAALIACGDERLKLDR